MSETKLESQVIQAAQYTYPYHYIPQVHNRVYLSRHWSFGASYLAALKHVSKRLFETAENVGSAWRHIDIGCGDGALVNCLMKLKKLNNSQIEGVDIDENAIAWARLFNPGVKFSIADLSELNGQAYHSASLVEVLEHIPPDMISNFVANASKLLRPKGLLVVTVPSVEKPVVNKHFQHFSFDSIRLLLEPHFENLEVYGFERENIFSRIVQRMRINPIARIDAPFLNKIAIHNLARHHATQDGCGRIFVVCWRK